MNRPLDAKLKLDLHTHCQEATGYRPATVEIVSRIVTQVKAAGLDGIGITEHFDKGYGFSVKEIVEKHFDSQVLIIPGQEVDIGSRQEVELYLPDGSIFRFLAHPGYPGVCTVFDNVQGIEINNSLHNWHINKPWVTEVAEKHKLLLLSNSDAHYVHNIGEFYNEISLGELMARSKKPPQAP